MPPDDAEMPLPAPSAGAPERRAQRHNVTRFVWYHTIDPVGADPIEGLSYSVDVSHGGLGLVIQEAIPVDGLVMVVVAFHGDLYNLSAVCRVVHASPTQEGAYRVGLEYVVLPPDARQFLTQKLV